eukprot:scaffold2751_cov344-Prasinococcus_capsulatus_cf.AAC.1
MARAGGRGIPAPGAHGRWGKRAHGHCARRCATLGAHAHARARARAHARRGEAGRARGACA